MILIGNINEIINDDFIEYCKFISKNYNKKPRSQSEILKTTLYGEAVERLVCKYLNLTQTCYYIIDYDAIENNNKYEIKHTVMDANWWTFNSEYYRHFMSKSKTLDYIVLCYVDLKTNNVYLKYKANSKTFLNYIKKSKYNESYYYDNKSATYNKECIEY